MLVTGTVLLVVFSLINLDRCSYTDPGGRTLEVRSVILDLKIALDCYQADFGHFPLQESGRPKEDIFTRSRGTLLQVLRGENVSMLNPREIKYAEFPMARNRKRGLWQDGDEWVLSDLWGEPYHMILDTNGDHKIANPEFGASASNPKQAEFDLKHPQPETLPLRVAIYSSGPDRDPKTWQDNVCSWRSH